MVAGVEVAPTPHLIQHVNGPMSSTPNKFSSSGLGVRPSLSDDMFRKAMAEGGVPEGQSLESLQDFLITNRIDL